MDKKKNVCPFASVKSCLRGQGHSQKLTSSCLKSTLTFCHLSGVSWRQFPPATYAGGFWVPRREASFWERHRRPFSFPRKSPLAKASHVVWGSVNGIPVFCALKFLPIKERSSFSISIKFINIVFGVKLGDLNPRFRSWQLPREKLPEESLSQPSESPDRVPEGQAAKRSQSYLPAYSY